MTVKAVNEDDWKDMTPCVILNPTRSAMFNDRELSGLHLTQWENVVDSEGNEIKNWGHVPKGNDCSRIKIALNAGLLFKCNPKGQSVHIPAPIVAAKSMDDLMGRQQRDLIAIVDQITTTDLLYKMKDWEEARPKNECRLILLQAISTRLKSERVVGVTRVGSNTAVIRNELTGDMEPDVVGISSPPLD